MNHRLQRVWVDGGNRYMTAQFPYEGDEPDGEAAGRHAVMAAAKRGEVFHSWDWFGSESDQQRMAEWSGEQRQQR